MSFRVNHNIPALTAHRSLQTNHANLAKNLERLSSGMKINRAVDGPAAFVISEHMRSQSAGLNQAIENSELAVSMIQTTEANMGEVTSLLNNIRQLAVHAANEGPNSQTMLQADQTEIDNILKTISGISEKARFADKNLLDGSMETKGITVGENLEFVTAGQKTADSTEQGYEVRVTQLSTKAKVVGTVVFTPEIIEGAETLRVIEDGKEAIYTTSREDTADTVLKNLQAAMDRQGIDIKVDLDETGRLSLIHRQYGSNYGFQVSSSTAGVLSQKAGDITVAQKGEDIKGFINGETAYGKGQVLTGVKGSKCVDGLSVRYYGEGKDVFLPEECELSDLEGETPIGAEVQAQSGGIPPEGIVVGRVYISQNAKKFQVGGNEGQTMSISIKGVHPDQLATDVINQSGFESLSDIEVLSQQGAQDTIRMVDVALQRITSNRGELGAFQKNTLESNLSNIRIANENLISSESIIRDTDMAKEMASFTRNQIMAQSSNAMLAQANQMPENVRQLLG